MKKDITEDISSKGHSNPSLSDADFEFMKERLEKISLVLYYISKEWSDDEPLKKSIRQVAIESVSIARKKEVLSPEALHQLAHGFTVQKDKLEPLIRLAVSGGFLSQAAAAVFKEELAGLQQRFLSPVQQGLLPSFERRSVRSPQSTKSKEGSPLGATHVSPDRSGGSSPIRKDQILSAVKEGVEYSIRDIVGAVPGVSEKTIQRELSRLVSEGVLVKKGERRWSTYRRA